MFIVNRRFAFVTLPVVAAGIIGGAALGLAGTANAASTDVQAPHIVASPSTIAAAPSATAAVGNSGSGTVALPPGGPVAIFPGDSIIGGANPYTPFGTNPYVPWGAWTP